MNSLEISSTEDTPEIIFNPENNNFIIEGRSLPENAIEFYTPILEWLSQYSKDPLNNTVINIKLEYFNTASAKQIAKVLKIMEAIAKKNTVLIKWYYNPIDSDMLYSGKRYEKLITLNFEFIEI